VNFLEVVIGQRKIKMEEDKVAVSCQTINFGNISDNRNLIIIINGSQERIGSLDITTRSLVVYSRVLSE